MGDLQRSDGGRMFSRAQIEIGQRLLRLQDPDAADRLALQPNRADDPPGKTQIRSRRDTQRLAGPIDHRAVAGTLQIVEKILRRAAGFEGFAANAIQRAGQGECAEDMPILIFKRHRMMDQFAECCCNLLQAAGFEGGLCQRAVNPLGLLQQAGLLGEDSGVQLFGDQRKRDFPRDFDQRQLQPVGFFAEGARKMIEKARHSQPNAGEFLPG